MRKSLDYYILPCGCRVGFWKHNYFKTMVARAGQRCEVPSKCNFKG
jgi:hypothetical protein